MGLTIRLNDLEPTERSSVMVCARDEVAHQRFRSGMEATFMKEKLEETHAPITEEQPSLTEQPEALAGACQEGFGRRWHCTRSDTTSATPLATMELDMCDTAATFAGSRSANRLSGNR